MAYIELNSKNLKHNLSLLQKRSNGKLAVVLKDNAYGHGLVEIAKIASDFGIKEAVVADYKEAMKIKNLFSHTLILGGEIVEGGGGISFAINDLESLKSVSKSIKLELKVDTGMHRNGIAPNQLQEALAIIKSRDLNLFGVMSHYRSADELSSEYFWQKKLFSKIKLALLKAGFEGVRFHSHNSSALLRTQSFDEDIARVGISIYGYSCLPESFGKFGLKPVLSLWADRVSTKFLRAGTRIGYGGDFVVPRDGLYSTYNLGYGDGWPRGDSKKAYILPTGERVIGRVSMDFITLEGDRERVCIMDSAKLASTHFDTISYEMTTRLSPYLKRIVV